MTNQSTAFQETQLEKGFKFRESVEKGQLSEGFKDRKKKTEYVSRRFNERAKHTNNVRKGNNGHGSSYQLQRIADQQKRLGDLTAIIGKDYDVSRTHNPGEHQKACSQFTSLVINYGTEVVNPDEIGDIQAYSTLHDEDFLHESRHYNRHTSSFQSKFFPALPLNYLAKLLTQKAENIKDIYGKDRTQSKFDQNDHYVKVIDMEDRFQISESTSIDDMILVANRRALETALVEFSPAYSGGKLTGEVAGKDISIPYIKSKSTRQDSEGIKTVRKILSSLNIAMDDTYELTNMNVNGRDVGQKLYLHTEVFGPKNLIFSYLSTKQD